MADIDVSDFALSDWRFRALGAALGVSHFDARGRCEAIWYECLNRETYYLSAVAVDTIAELPGFVEHMISAHLARRVRDGAEGFTVYICGTRGRIEWLRKKRRDGRRNGKKGAEFGKLGGRPKKTPAKPGEGVTENPPSASASASASTSTSTSTQKPPRARARNGTRLNADQLATLDPRRPLCLELWAEQEHLRQASIPGARQREPGEVDLLRIAERLADRATEDDCRHVLRVRAAEARKGGDGAKYFNGVSNWRAESFRFALGQADPAKASLRAAPAPPPRQVPAEDIAPDEARALLSGVFGEVSHGDD